ncbi:MAG TPA: hypothetical protein VFZ73_09685 [Gemmatimonadaceae bacterium]
MNAPFFLPRSTRRAGWFVAVLLAGSITLTQQKWVGGVTLYAPEHQARRDVIHQSILTNELPDSVRNWSSLGANGLSARLLVVMAAEGIHRATGSSLRRSYLFIETVALFACCLLLYAFLEQYAGIPFALAGLLYFGTVLPLTYLNHYFHPWDRPSIATWLLALIFAWRRSWVALAVVLAIGVAIKYDIVVFPLLVFLAFRTTDPPRVNLARAGGLMAVTGFTYALLRWFAPNGFEPRPLGAQVARNLEALSQTLYLYPPLLALGLPAVLAAVGYSRSDQFARACVWLAVVVAAILFLQTNFVEFRAEVPLLLLLLPSAWHGFQRLTSTSRPTGDPVPLVKDNR